MLTIDEGFDFLGHNIRRQRKRGTTKHYVYTRPSKKAIQAVKDKVRAKTHRSTRNQDLGQLITSLNPDTCRVGEVFQTRGVQGDLQHDRQPRMGSADAVDT